MNLAFSFFDLVVVLVVIGSAIYATVYGFVDESLSIFAWAAAAFGALYLGPWAADLLRTMIAAYWLATVVGYGAVFLAVFIPLSFVSHRLAQSVKSSVVGPVDRVLGTTFGIVRGLAILGIAYLVFTSFVPIRSQPSWLTRAQTLPLIQSSSEVLLSLVPSRSREDTKPVAPAAQKALNEVEPLPPSNPKSGKTGKKGYGVGDRRALDRLFEATGNGR